MKSHLANQQQSMTSSSSEVNEFSEFAKSFALTDPSIHVESGQMSGLPNTRKTPGITELSDDFMKLPMVSNSVDRVKTSGSRPGSKVRVLNLHSAPRDEKIESLVNSSTTSLDRDGSRSAKVYTPSSWREDLKAQNKQIQEAQPVSLISVSQMNILYLAHISSAH